MPGSFVKATLVTKFPSKLLFKYMDFDLTVHRSHFISDENYNVGCKIPVYIITVDPGTKQLTGSLLSHFNTPENDLIRLGTLGASSLGCLSAKIGVKFTNAIVNRVEKRTIHVKLDELDVSADIHKSNLPPVFLNKKLSSCVKLGNPIACRIIDHDLFLDVAIATMNKKLMDLPYLSIDALNPGDKVTAIVTRFTKTGIAVRVGGRLPGLIPYLHCGDAIVRRPEEKFARGQQVDCLVLTADIKLNKLLLTTKPSLVNARLPLLGCQAMLEGAVDNGAGRADFHHQTFIGFIAKVSWPRGLLIAGLNNIRGWLPRRETDLDDNDSNAFYKGQVIRFRVKRRLKFNDDNDHMQRSSFLLSLKLDVSKTDSSARSKSATSAKSSSSVKIGEIFYAKLLHVQGHGMMVDLHRRLPGAGQVTSVDDLKLSPTVGRGFLAFNQLSDCGSDRSARIGNLLIKRSQGSLLTLDDEQQPLEVVVINLSPSVSSGNDLPILTARQSIVCAAAAQTDGLDQQTGFLHSYDQLKVGTRWYGWIVNHVEYGLFVQFPAGVRGLVPKRLLSDTRPPKSLDSATDLYPRDATVVGQIVEIGAEAEKRRCLASLRMTDTYDCVEQYAHGGIQFSRRWLHEQRFLWKSQYPFLLGDRVRFTVEQLNKRLIVGSVTVLQQQETDQSSPAFCRLVNYDSQSPAAGQHLTGVVVGFDHGGVEVALLRWLDRALEQRANLTNSVVGRRDVQGVTLTYTRRQTAVVALKGAGSVGRLALVPTRRSYNDLLGDNAFEVGQRVGVTIREEFDQGGPDSLPIYLATVSIHDPIDQPALADTATTTNIKLVKGDRLTDWPLQFQKLSGQTAFFQVNGVTRFFCHLINFKPTARLIRAFQRQPPSADSPVVVDTHSCTVLAEASPNTAGARRRNRLALSQPHLTELTFLDKTTVENGDFLCAQLVKRHRDFWTIWLPGSHRGRLHLTGMVHQPSSKASTVVGDDDPGRLVNSSTCDMLAKLKPNQYLMCRVIDSVDDGDDNESERRLFYVSTIPEVKQGGLGVWQDLKSGLDKPIDAFVKARGVNGLLLSLTHQSDIFVPLLPSLKRRCDQLGIRFRVGSQVKVVANRCIGNGRLVGELFIDPNLYAYFADDLVEYQNGQLLDSVTRDLLNELSAVDAQRSRKRKRRGVVTASASVNHVVTSAHDEEPSSAKRSRLDTVANDDNCDAFAAFMSPEDDQSTARSPISDGVLAETCSAVIPSAASAASNEWASQEATLYQAMIDRLAEEEEGEQEYNSVEAFELVCRNSPLVATNWIGYVLNALRQSPDPRQGLSRARSIIERGLKAMSTMTSGVDRNQLARLLYFALVIEGKELERCLTARDFWQMTTGRALTSATDPVLQLTGQSQRVSDLVNQLVDLNQPVFDRKALDTLIDIGQADRAEELARRLVKKSPTVADRWLTLVRVRLRIGKLELAREAQRNASCLLIDKPACIQTFLTGCASAELEFGDADKSFQLFHDLITAHPKQKPIYDEYIRALLLAGRDDDAKTLLKQAGTKLKPKEIQSLRSCFPSIVT